jgi:hypothetical protein
MLPVVGLSGRAPHVAVRRSLLRVAAVQTDILTTTLFASHLVNLLSAAPLVTTSIPSAAGLTVQPT